MQKPCFKKMLTLFTLLLLGSSVFIPLPRPGKAGGISFPEIEATAAVLMEFSRGEVIYAHGENEPMPPASLTKVMTLLLAFEAIHKGQTSWDDPVTISEKAWRTGGSQMYLEINQVVPFGELITGIASISANDACVAVAEHLNGSESRFVEEMNRRAQELGLTSTLFQNASGLPHQDHYSSALDLARLARYYIQQFPEALELHARQEFTFNDILQHNRNPLLGRLPGTDGLKTGHTAEAGYCLIATAQQKGMRFIVVLLNGSSRASRLRDSEILFNYAFRNYTRHLVFSRKEKVDTVEISGGIIRQLDLLAEEAVEVILPFHRQDDLIIETNYPRVINAPVSQNEPLGNALIYLDDTLVAETALVAAESVEKAGYFTLAKRSLGDFFTGLWRCFSDWLSGFLPKQNPA